MTWIHLEKGIFNFFVEYYAKKFGIHKLGDSLSISVQYISMREGWGLKPFNIFLTIG